MCVFVCVCVCAHAHVCVHVCMCVCVYQDLGLLIFIHSLGEGCSHVAAVLFKVDAAVRNGYTSVTSNSCQLNQVFSKKVR